MIRLEAAGPIAVATLARPPVNAIDEAWIGSLREALAKTGSARVLLVRSAEKAFSAGADLALMRARFATEAGRDPASIMRASSLSLDDLDTARKHAGKWRDAGCGYLVCGWPEAGRPQVEAFVREVLPDFT